ncbi:acyltransferase [Aeromicrobium marinum DSM 15272]|uniref:Acyltransferase n=1 Tax=Aeromicrobium marinum DSM 15272 TaxID=585531 RepID=E2SG28_9ACTN|nr:acyltransferase [Aeromicrobium marinum]EFQ81785.1 acyltransferase [Aeromicrobium marinum DSM 15272]
MTAATAAEGLPRTFDPRTNSLNLFRLVLAAMVLFAHAFYLDGRGIGPHIQGENLGGLAVGGFFVLSGFLITTSRFRNAVGDYIVLRVARIFPAFIVCLVLTATVLAPFAMWWEFRSLDGYLTTGPTPASYVWSNAGLLINQYEIGRSLESVPYPRVWNGSLWTLYYEFACYLLVGVIAVVGVVRRSPWPLAAMFALSVAVYATETQWAALQLDERFFLLAKLLPYFLGGAVAYFVVARFGVPHVAGATALVLAVASIVLVPRVGGQLAAPLLAWGLLWLSTVVPQPRWVATNDISYGFYIYAWPVQQLGVLVGVSSLGFVAYLLLTAVGTAALAALSWFAVERPVMRAAHTRLRATRPARA